MTVYIMKQSLVDDRNLKWGTRQKAWRKRRRSSYKNLKLCHSLDVGIVEMVCRWGHARIPCLVFSKNTTSDLDRRFNKNRSIKFRRRGRPSLEACRGWYDIDIYISTFVSILMEFVRCKTGPLGFKTKIFDEVRAETSFANSGLTGIFIKVIVIKSPKTFRKPTELQPIHRYTGKGPNISRSPTGLQRKRYLYLTRRYFGVVY